MPQGLASDYIGVTLIAKGSCTALTYANDTAPKYTNFSAGDIVGKIDTYVQKNGFVFWSFQVSSLKSFYVKHEENLFDWSKADNAIIRKNILARGGDVTEFDKEARNKKFWGYGLKIGGSLALTYVLKRFIDKKIS